MSTRPAGCGTMPAGHPRVPPAESVAAATSQLTSHEKPPGKARSRRPTVVALPGAKLTFTSMASPVRPGRATGAPAGSATPSLTYGAAARRPASSGAGVCVIASPCSSTSRRSECADCQ